MTETETRPQTPVPVSGIFGGYIIGQLSLWLAPVFVAEFMHAYAISEREIGLSFGLQAGAIALVSLYCSYKVDVLRLRKLAFTGVILALAAHGLSLAADTFQVFTLCRIVAGIGEGMAFAAANITGAAVKNPDRVFAQAQLASMSVVVVLLFAVPEITALYGFRVSIGAMILALIVSTPLIARLPVTNTGNDAISAGKARHYPLPLLGIGILIAFTLVNLSDIGIWVFSERIATQIGITPDAVSWSLGAASILAMGGPLLAALLGDRFGIVIPLTAGLVLEGCSALLVVYATGPISYSAGLVLLLISIGFLYPYFLGVLARLDEHGSWTTLSGTVVSFAMAVGPVISGLVAAQAGYISVGWFTVGFCIVALSILLAALQSLNRCRTSKTP